MSAFFFDFFSFFYFFWFKFARILVKSENIVANTQGVPHFSVDIVAIALLISSVNIVAITLGNTFLLFFIILSQTIDVQVYIVANRSTIGSKTPRLNLDVFLRIVQYEFSIHNEALAVILFGYLVWMVLVYRFVRILSNVFWVRICSYIVEHIVGSVFPIGGGMVGSCLPTGGVWGWLVGCVVCYFLLFHLIICILDYLITNLINCLMTFGWSSCEVVICW